MLDRILGFIDALVANPRKALRSALTTALAVSAALVAMQQLGAPIPGDWIAWSTAAIAALRWVLGALDPKQTLYGRGSA